MKIFLEYFGLLVFVFVLLVSGAILMPHIADVPETSVGGMVRLGLAFVVIAGGFTWYYFATSHQGGTNQEGDRVRAK
jgi:drug/metabolite transporter (DMT)-like permease